MTEKALVETREGHYEKKDLERIKRQHADEVLKYIIGLLKGEVIVGYDSQGVEYELRYTSDEGYFYLERNTNGFEWTVRFEEVEKAGKKAYFLLENDNVRITVEGFDDGMDTLGTTLDALSSQYRR